MINYFGIASIVSITYLCIWLINRKKESFRLRMNKDLSSILIVYSIGLATINSIVTLFIICEDPAAIAIMIIIGINLLIAILVAIALTPKGYIFNVIFNKKDNEQKSAKNSSN